MKKDLDNKKCNTFVRKAGANQSSISSNIPFLCCWMKCWTDATIFFFFLFWTSETIFWENCLGRNSKFFLKNSTISLFQTGIIFMLIIEDIQYTKYFLRHRSVSWIQPYHLDVFFCSFVNHYDTGACGSLYELELLRICSCRNGIGIKNKNQLLHAKKFLVEKFIPYRRKIRRLLISCRSKMFVG